WAAPVAPQATSAATTRPPATTLRRRATPARTAGPPGSIRRRAHPPGRVRRGVRPAAYRAPGAAATARLTPRGSGRGAHHPAARARAERPVHARVHRVGRPPHRAVPEQRVHPAGVVAAREVDGVLRLLRAAGRPRAVDAELAAVPRARVR